MHAPSCLEAAANSTNPSYAAAADAARTNSANSARLGLSIARDEVERLYLTDQ
jgi:hypothetical protein